ncbi:MAG: hypothetical protein A4E27_01233 [Methanobacterium sp. PtaU1.Bin242]|nr:MAG: hypothetical protein A4E27_01233 [Methanobacterium sp. PtaU1.Bin242]
MDLKILYWFFDISLNPGVSILFLIKNSFVLILSVEISVAFIPEATTGSWYSFSSFSFIAATSLSGLSIPISGTTASTSSDSAMSIG